MLSNPLKKRNPENILVIPARQPGAVMAMTSHPTILLRNTQWYMPDKTSFFQIILDLNESLTYILNSQQLIQQQQKVGWL